MEYADRPDYDALRRLLKKVVVTVGPSAKSASARGGRSAAQKKAPARKPAAKSPRRSARRTRIRERQRERPRGRQKGAASSGNGSEGSHRVDGAPAEYGGRVTREAAKVAGIRAAKRRRRGATMAPLSVLMDIVYSTIIIE